MTILDPFQMAADLFDPTPDPLLDDPPGWVEAKTREWLWSKQREVFEAVKVHRKVAVKSCHGSGKSWSASRLALWWIDTHPAGSAFVASTAPRQDQVEVILWREIGKGHRKAAKNGTPLPGRILGNCQWKVGTEPVGIGRKPADHDENGFQGIHERYVLLVIDEANGIPEALWTGSGNILTNDDARVLAIGNPDDPTSHFAGICAGSPDDGSSGLSAQGWWVITISAFDTPNFTGEVVPDELTHNLVGPAWVDEKRVEWGEGSPLWTSKVLGRFPENASDTTIPWAWLRRCQGEQATAGIGPLRIPVELGVDVGGSENGDETVIRERRGGQAGREWRIRSGDPEVVCALVAQARRESEATRVKYDAGGIGFAVGTLATLAAREGWELVPVQFGGEAKDSQKYANVRAELWWMGRELSRQAAWDLTALDDASLNELATPKYREDASGRILIEKKDEVRKRIGRSPDHADAVLLAFYDPPAVAVATQTSYKDNRLRGRR